MLGFFYAILSAISFSTNNIFLKKTSKKINTISALLLIYFFITILSFITSIFFGDFSHEFNLKLFGFIFLIGFFGAIGIFTLLRSFEKLSIAKSLAVANFNPFITLFLVFIFFGQKVSIFSIFTMLIVFVGILLTLNSKLKFKLSRNSSKKISKPFMNKFINNKNILFPIITSISWGSYYFILDNLNKLNINSFNIVFYTEISIFLNLLIYVLLNKKIKFEFSKINLKISSNAFFAGLFAALGVLFFILSIKYIKTPITTSIVSSQVIFSSIFAYLFFNEKLNKKQIIGIFIVFLGLVLFQIL